MTIAVGTAVAAAMTKSSRSITGQRSTARPVRYSPGPHGRPGEAAQEDRSARTPGARAAHAPPRSQPRLGVPEARLPRRQPRDRRVPAPALQAALPRGLRGGRHRAAPVRGRRDEIVGYAECAFEVTGTDNWINPRYFEKRDMRPLFVEELAVHPGLPGPRRRRVHARAAPAPRARARLHAPRARGRREQRATRSSFYRKRNFYKLDAAIFMAQKVVDRARAPAAAAPAPAARLEIAVAHAAASRRRARVTNRTLPSGAKRATPLPWRATPRPSRADAVTPVAVRAPRGGTVVEIDWADGHTALLPNRRLRGFCPCAGCQGHGEALHFVEGGNEVIDSIHEIGNYALAFRWGRRARDRHLPLRVPAAAVRVRRVPAALRGGARFVLAA